MRLIDANKLRDTWIWGRTDRWGQIECIELPDLDEAPTVEAIPIDFIKTWLLRDQSMTPREHNEFVAVLERMTNDWLESKDLVSPFNDR